MGIQIRGSDDSISAADGSFTLGGNIGIGTDNPGAKLEVFDETSNTILNVKSGDAGAVLNLIDPSQRSSIEQSGTTLKIISDTGAEFANSDIRLQVDGASKMRVQSTGNIAIDNGNLVFSTSGTGIDFSATSDGSGTMSSELLDDYEEGTWTPDLQFGGAKVGISYNSQYGRYTKVGNLITVIGRITLSSKGSSGGIARFFGLPYVTESITGTQMSIGSLWYSGFNLQGSIVQVVIRTDGNGNSFVEPKGVTTNAEDAIGDSDFANNTDMVFTISYRTP